MASAAASVRAPERRPTAKSAIGPSSGGAGRVGAVAARRARKALLAELLSHVEGIDGQLSTPAHRAGTCQAAVRYLQMSRPAGMAPARNPEEQAKLNSDLADVVVSVITAVLKGLHLSEDDYKRGTDLAAEALRAVAAEGWQPL